MKKTRTIKKIFIKYSLIYVGSVIFTFFISSLYVEKNIIQTMENYNILYSLLSIILKNTFSFLFLIYGSMNNKYIIYSWLVGNGIILGSLISKFAHFSYMILILPHGIFEMFSYIYLCTIISSWKNNNGNKISVFFKKIKRNSSIYIYC
ncbi:hypothetical protein HV819_04170 [Anaerococcus sp. AGMB00486]|uniref:Stage II sporulation protein M n=1 Tax=Anaerococcus faecalis TaxID=2742993 RepID=A0ABX2N968_9FIRM|nr:hypothetical protein [Anaerococcus faecalis]NVF11188.1 hypothetical protein [Anaerococcus faecalis]